MHTVELAITSQSHIRVRLLKNCKLQVKRTLMNKWMTNQDKLHKLKQTLIHDQWHKILITYLVPENSQNVEESGTVVVPLQ